MRTECSGHKFLKVDFEYQKPVKNNWANKKQNLMKAFKYYLILVYINR